MSRDGAIITTTSVLNISANNTNIDDLTDTATIAPSHNNLFTELTEGFTNYIGNLVNGWAHKRCDEWQQPHHIYFQVANSLFLIAFLSPNGSYGALCTRCALVLASIFLILWNYFIECSLDALVWSSSFLCINFVYLTILMYRLRPIRFEKEIDAVYEALFKPLHVSRHQFRKILNCMKIIRSLKYQEVYAQEKVTKVDSLSLVLSGKLVVSQNQRALHIVFQHQFLDSPEWFGVSTDDYFQVSIMAMEDSRVLIWHRDKLRLSIIGEPFLQTIFDHILGKDVVKKLMQVTQVNETLSNSNGHLQSLDENGFDDKPMLQSKMNGNDDQGFTALINRQLQDEHVPLLGRQQSKPYMLQKQSAFCTNHRLNNKTSPC